MVTFIRELIARGFLDFLFFKLIKSDHLGITLHVPIRYYFKNVVNTLFDHLCLTLVQT